MHQTFRCLALLVALSVLANAKKIPTLPSKGSTVDYCGTSRSSPFEDRIVGGSEATPHEFPWMCKIYSNRAFHCGAVLISDRHILTAGHCVTTPIEEVLDKPATNRGNLMNYVVDPLSGCIVELGAHYLHEKATNVLRRPALRISINPNFNFFASDGILLQTNDIAIIEIQPVNFTKLIQPVCLPMPHAKLPDGSQLVVAGWGSVLTETLKAPTTELPNVLKKTVLTKIGYRKCRKNPNIGPHLTVSHNLTSREIFCMTSNHQDSCRGDSGGPAVLETTKGYTLAGLVSWGLGCNQTNYPSVYTHVSSYIDFITENTRNGLFLPHKP